MSLILIIIVLVLLFGGLGGGYYGYRGGVLWRRWLRRYWFDRADHCAGAAVRRRPDLVNSAGPGTHC
jgi:hypothetical protein